MCHGPEQSRPPALVEKGERKVRLVGRLTSRKAVTVVFDRHCRLKRQRQRHSPAAPVVIRSPFLPHQQSDCVCVAPWWRSLDHETLPLGFVTPITAPDVMGPNHPETTCTLAPFLSRWPPWNRDSLHDRVAGSGLDAQSKQPVWQCKAQLIMQDISADTAYKNVGDWCLLNLSMRVAPRHHADVSTRAVIMSRGFLAASGQPQACTYPPCPVYALTGCL